MNWQTAVVLVLLGVAALVSLTLCTFAWRRQTMPIARPFAFMTLGLSIWSGGYALEIASFALEAKILWAQVQYLGIVLLPASWFLLAQAYAGQLTWLRPRRVLLLNLLPALTAVGAFTNGWHGWLWRTTGLNTDGPFAVMDATYGPLWYTFFVYSYLLLLSGSVILFIALRKFPALYRWQSAALLLTPILPWIGNALYVFRVSPIPQIDLAPLLFTVSTFILGTAVLRFRLFDMVPIAHQAVIAHMPIATVLLDQKNRIVDLNPAARELLGSEAPDPLGRSAREVLNTWAATTLRYQETYETSEDISLYINGLKRHFNLRIAPIYSGGQLSGRLIMLHDITNDKLVDEALASSYMKTEFWATVGHELRDPISAILGRAEMLDLALLGPVNAKQREALNKIIEHAAHLNELLNDISQSARMEMGNISLDITEFLARDLVNQVREATRERIVAKRLRLVTEITEDVPRLLRGDPLRLLQVVVSLVETAVEHTASGEISLRLFCPGESSWGIRIADTGEHIPPSELEALFNLPLRSARGTAVEAQPQVDMGLMMAQKLIHLMGGDISAESLPGVGNRFTVTLPFDK